VNDNGVAIQVQMASEYKPIDRAFWNSSSSKPYIKHNFPRFGFSSLLLNAVCWVAWLERWLVKYRWLSGSRDLAENI
jgi:hypothetical protein